MTSRKSKAIQYNIDSQTNDLYKWITTAIIALAIFILLLSAVYTINAGQRGVLLTFGKPSMNAVGEGLHFKFPLVQKIRKMEVRTQKIETIADAASKDLQDVQTTIALNFHLSPSRVPKLYQEVGTAYVERIINPAIQESVKAVQARFTAEELVSRRTEVRSGIQDALTERLDKYYIVVDDFNIVNFQFSEEFDRAIEDKVTAEQRKLKAEMDLERIRVEKEQKITQAEAEAESIRIQSVALQQNKDILQLRAIEKWDGVMPKVTGGATPFINLDSVVRLN
jgi:regulator of protease activity HflC (stomatin/prohibitin superfamily)